MSVTDTGHAQLVPASGPLDLLLPVWNTLPKDLAMAVTSVLPGSGLKTNASESDARPVKEACLISPTPHQEDAVFPEARTVT